MSNEKINNITTNPPIILAINFFCSPALETIKRKYNIPPIAIRIHSNMILIAGNLHNPKPSIGKSRNCPEVTANQHGAQVNLKSND